MEQKIIDAIRRALLAIREPRYFETERGYQAELYSELRLAIKSFDFGGAKPIVEQEYQKLIGLHGMQLRPDILIHEPFSPQRHADRKQGNYAVIELKLNATIHEAKGDFERLAVMMERLSYPLGVFVNLASIDTRIECACAPRVGRIVAFAASLKDGVVHVAEDAV